MGCENQEDSSGAAGDLAVLGEGTERQTNVSIQVLQNVYHELTAKTEDVSKAYDEPFQLELKDLEQLDHRVNQCCEQYHLASSNCSVKVFYTSDTQETFSSFAKFRLFNAGSTSSVESVLLTYNFLIILPKLKKPQAYTLSIRIASPIAIQERLRDGSIHFRMPKIFRAMGTRTAMVTVKYIDYVVARTLLDTFDQWFKTAERAAIPAWWMWICRRSHLLPIIGRYLTFSVACLVLMWSLPAFITATSTLLDLCYLVLSAVFGISVAYQVANYLGKFSESSLDTWTALSFIALTSGDRKLIDKAKNANRRAVVSSGIKWFGSLMVSVLVKLAIESFASRMSSG